MKIYLHNAGITLLNVVHYRWILRRDRTSNRNFVQ